METMKALVWKEKGKVELCDRPMPKIQDPRDAIVRVTRASICSSDLHIIHGTVPRAKEGVVLGHEFVGEVVETGSAVRHFKAGDRVEKNQTLLTIEAMKMETAVTARMAGTVESVLVRERETVKGGQLLITLK